jgi:hypothetical protein
MVKTAQITELRKMIGASNLLPKPRAIQHLLSQVFLGGGEDYFLLESSLKLFLKFTSQCLYSAVLTGLVAAPLTFLLCPHPCFPKLLILYPEYGGSNFLQNVDAL